MEITNTGNRVLHVEGEAELELVIPCDRCLEDVHWSMILEIDKEIDMKQTSEDRIKALDEHYYIDGYNLDVDKLLYGEILVNWPLHVLCKEDCLSLIHIFNPYSCEAFVSRKGRIPAPIHSFKN